MIATALQKRPAGIAGWLDTDLFQQKIAVTLNRHMTVKRFIDVLKNYVDRNPKLLECRKESFFTAVKRAAELGLELDGRDCALVPRDGTVEFQPMYFGLEKIARRADPNIKKIRAEVVCEGDEFEHNLGQITKHTWNATKVRGPVTAAYCQVIYADGDQYCEILPMADILSCKARSKAPQKAWTTDFNMMARKSAIIRACKQLPFGEQMPDDDDRTIDVDSKVATIAGKPIGAPADDDIPMEFAPAAEVPAIAPQTAPAAPESSAQPKSSGKVENAMAVILDRLDKAGIKKSDWDGWFGVPMAEWEPETVLNVSADIDNQIAEFRKA